MLYSALFFRSRYFVHALSVAGRGLLVSTLLVLIGLSTSAVEAQSRAYSADEVKAAFLYRFGTYVEWPSVGPPGDAITIAILGAPSIATQLAAYLPGRTIQGHPVAVRPIRRIEDVGDAQLLFIGEERSSMLTELIDRLGKRPVLVVTDAADGLAHGAMVNFQLVEQRVRFEISLRKAQDVGLMLSSRLLSAAIRVETSGCWYDCRDVHPTPELALIQRLESLQALALPESLPSLSAADAERTARAARRPSKLIADLAVDDHGEQPSATDDVAGERG